MNYSPEICTKAQRYIDDRRGRAAAQLAARQDEIYRLAPEVREIQRQASSAVTQLSKLIITKKGSFEDNFQRIKRNNIEAQNYIRQILVSKGFSEDYLEIKYTCSACNDTGFNKEGRRCTCFEQLAAKLAVEELNKSANMPDCDFEHFDLEFYPKELDSNGVVPYEKMTEVYKFCRLYAQNFSDRSRSLLMIGKTGVGKTHLSLSVAKQLTEKGINCAYGSVLNFLHEIEREHYGRGEPGRDTLSALTETEFLVLDDLGAENYSPLYESTLYNIINTRINMSRPTIISTNLSQVELSEKYNERILSRIFGVYTLLRFYGRDIRQEKRLRGM